MVVVVIKYQNKTQQNKRRRFEKYKQMNERTPTNKQMLLCCIVLFRRNFFLLSSVLLNLSLPCSYTDEQTNVVLYSIVSSKLSFVIICPLSLPRSSTCFFFAYRPHDYSTASKLIRHRREKK